MFCQIFATKKAYLTHNYDISDKGVLNVSARKTALNRWTATDNRCNKYVYLFAYGIYLITECYTAVLHGLRKVGSLVQLTGVA